MLPASPSASKDQYRRQSGDNGPCWPRNQIRTTRVDMQASWLYIVRKQRKKYADKVRSAKLNTFMVLLVVSLLMWYRQLRKALILTTTLTTTTFPDKDPKRVVCAQPRGDVSYMSCSYLAYYMKQLLSGRCPPYQTDVGVPGAKP